MPTKRPEPWLPLRMFTIGAAQGALMSGLLPHGIGGRAAKIILLAVTGLRISKKCPEHWSGHFWHRRVCRQSSSIIWRWSDQHLVLGCRQAKLRLPQAAESPEEQRCCRKNRLYQYFWKRAGCYFEGRMGVCVWLAPCGRGRMYH